MIEYVFLFSLAFIWIIFASIQDMRTTEISNWLTFSLIIFAMVFRAFYSLLTKDASFFLFGLGGLALFVGLAYSFYYGKVFAGGDAKLLMGIGAVLPFESLGDYLSLSLMFVFLLFLAGACYSICYTLFLAIRHHKRFRKTFKIQFRKQYTLFLISVALAITIAIFIYSNNYPNIFYFASLLIVSLPLLLAYTKAVESSCFIREVLPENLMEGDWLIEDIIVGKRVIKKTVHGLTKEEINFLRKHNKKIIVKYGVPFAPAFFIAFAAFLWIYTHKLEFFSLILP